MPEADPLRQAAEAFAAAHPEARADHDAALAELAAAREAEGPGWSYWLSDTDWDREVDIEDWHTPWPRGLEAQAESEAAAWPEAEAEA